jgi:hypothetical protein
MTPPKWIHTPAGDPIHAILAPVRKTAAQIVLGDVTVLSVERSHQGAESASEAQKNRTRSHQGQDLERSKGRGLCGESQSTAHGGAKAPPGSGPG